MFGRRALVRVTLLALLALVLLPTSAQAFSKAIWGPVFRDGVNQFPIYKQLGVSVWEAQLHWNEVAPTPPQDATDPTDPAYQWPAEIDQAITQASAFHIQVLLQVIGTPAWANGDRTPNWAPSAISSFSQFVTAAARRYPGVHLWMIWGEPTRAANFQPLTPARPGARLNASQRTGPHVYAQMLDAAYGALKQLDPTNVVIGGCTFTTGDIDTEQWIENLRLPNGRPPRMDLYAHNPFGPVKPDFSGPASPPGSVRFTDLPRLARWLDRYLHRGLRIFISEWTIPTAPDREFLYWVDPPVAAQWITAGLRITRAWRRMYGLGWVNFYDNPPLSYGGLIKANGHRKPLFYAFERG